MAEPRDYGPFDHVMNHWTDDGEQADMLSLDEDGDVEDHCEGDIRTATVVTRTTSSRLWTTTVEP